MKKNANEHIVKTIVCITVNDCSFNPSAATLKGAYSIIFCMNPEPSLFVAFLNRSVTKLLKHMNVIMNVAAKFSVIDIRNIAKVIITSEYSIKESMEFAINL